MNPLRVDTDEAYQCARAVGNDAEELREALELIQRDWDHLSHEWCGAASTAYESIWTEWLDGAIALVDALAESSHRLGRAAVQYSQQDASSATAAADVGL